MLQLVLPHPSLWKKCPKQLNATLHIVQEIPHLFRLVQTCSNLFRLVQTCSNLFKLVQTCLNLFKLVQTCSNLFKTWSLQDGVNSLIEHSYFLAIEILSKRSTPSCKHYGKMVYAKWRWIKLDLEFLACPNLNKLDQTWSCLFKLVQTCSNLIKLVQTWSNLFKLDQTWSN